MPRRRSSASLPTHNRDVAVVAGNEGIGKAERGLLKQHVAGLHRSRQFLEHRRLAVELAAPRLDQAGGVAEEQAGEIDAFLLQAVQRIDREGAEEVEHAADVTERLHLAHHLVGRALLDQRRQVALAVGRRTGEQAAMRLVPFEGAPGAGPVDRRIEGQRDAVERPARNRETAVAAVQVLAQEGVGAVEADRRQIIVVEHQGRR